MASHHRVGYCNSLLATGAPAPTMLPPEEDSQVLREMDNS